MDWVDLISNVSPQFLPLWIHSWEHLSYFGGSYLWKAKITHWTKTGLGNGGLGDKKCFVKSGLFSGERHVKWTWPLLSAKHQRESSAEWVQGIICGCYHHFHCSWPQNCCPYTYGAINNNYWDLLSLLSVTGEWNAVSSLRMGSMSMVKWI